MTLKVGIMVPTFWGSRENETQGCMAARGQGPKNAGWSSVRWDKATETSLTNRIPTVLCQALADAMVKKAEKLLAET